jgi:hypothetical protein
MIGYFQVDNFVLEPFPESPHTLVQTATSFILGIYHGSYLDCGKCTSNYST